MARQIAQIENVFFIGKGINYPVALEGALKLKEISYIHAEGYAAGELKHGPFALLGSQTPVVAIVAQDNTYEATMTSIKEIKARHSPVLAVVAEGDETMADLADLVITVPRIDPLFSPVVNSSSCSCWPITWLKSAAAPSISPGTWPRPSSVSHLLYFSSPDLLFSQYQHQVCGFLDSGEALGSELFGHRLYRSRFGHDFSH